MKLIFMFAGLLWLVPSIALSQCEPIDFDLPLNVCRNEKSLITHSLGEGTYSWDFCGGDLDNEPDAQEAFQIPQAIGRPGMDLVREGDTWIGFVTGTWSNTLHRLEFGNGPNESPTAIANFGDLNGMLKSPGQIRMIHHEGVWYGIVHNTTSADNTGEIMKLTFDNQLSEITSISILTSGVGYVNSGIAVGKDPVDGWVCIVSNSDNTLSIIRFGNDLHTSTPDDILNTSVVPGGNNVGDLDLINVCGEWFGAAVNFGGGNTYLLSFGQNLFSVPQIDQIASLAINNGARLRFLQEGETYFLLVASLDGLLHKLAFGSALHLNPIVTDEGDLNNGLEANIYGLAVAKENSVWSIYTVSQANGKVFRVTYPQNCSASNKTSIETSPIFSYESEGTYDISLTFHSEGIRTTKTKAITVIAQDAPDISVLTQNMCAGYDILFTTANVSGDILEHHWDFGDLSTPSGVSNPAHAYGSEGEYNVELEVIAENGCSNHAYESIAIYTKPDPSFTISSGLICTNNEIDFQNTTNDPYEGNLSYQWFVDGTLINTTRDLAYTFETTGTKSVKLVTSIPGCADEITKTTPSVEPGPAVDFSFTGTCEEEVFQFQNQLQENVVGYFWDFDTGDTSIDPNPSHTFSEFGDYSVSLTVTNTIGCENKKIKNVTVHSKPVIEFQTAGPPGACSGNLTQFVNQSFSTDASNITAWQWTFGDANNTATSGARDPQHIFQDANIYDVSLSATTEAGCTGTAINTITILPSPSTEFTLTPACDDQPTVFSAPAENDISYWYWEIGTAYYTSSSVTHSFRNPGEHSVMLEVGGVNGCRSSVNRMIVVPEPLDPEFSVIKNCIGHQAVFTDITTGADPVVSSEWQFDRSETVSGSPAFFTFSEGGIKTVQLEITGQSGCAYVISREVHIAPAPVANFTASPMTGGAPLEVSFVNTSSHATGFEWKFSDDQGLASTEVSPVFTFQHAGEHTVELTAFDDQQCEDTFTAMISTVAPLPDVDLGAISIAENADGTFRLIVTIHNKGNTVLKNLPVDVDFSGMITLREMVEEPIGPFSKYNLVLSPGIMEIENLRYVCVSTTLTNDPSPQGNRICEELENEAVIFAAYPNPGTTTLNVEWIPVGQATADILLIDDLGRTVLSDHPIAQPGLNHYAIDLSGLRNGVYYLLMDVDGLKKSQRILILGKP